MRRVQPSGSGAAPPASGGAGPRAVLARLERAQDALRALVADVQETEALAGPDQRDAKLSTVIEQLLVGRHKLDLYVQGFRREHASRLREGPD